jgi:hypothetical protein
MSRRREKKGSWWRSSPFSERITTILHHLTLAAKDKDFGTFSG